MQANEIVVFEENAVAEFGNKFLSAMLQHELLKEEAENELHRAANRESVIDTQFLQAIMHLHASEEIDVYRVYGDKQESSALYRGVLVSLGVLSRRVTETDRVIYEFTDTNLSGAYDFVSGIASYKYDAEKDKDNAGPEYPEDVVAEHKRARSRRNALNIRMQRVCKAAAALLDAKATTADIVLEQDASGEMVPKITKGPAEVMGKADAIEIQTGNSAKVEGATQTPTISGLAKVADATHKTQPVKKDGGEGNATNSASVSAEGDFVALINTALRAIQQREGEFSDTEKTAMKSLKTILGENGI